MSKLKIISWNINGIRTRFKNEEMEPIFNETPDIILFQETKAKYNQLEDELKSMEDYHSYFSPGEITRVGGIATFSKIKPKLVKKFFNVPDDLLKSRVMNLTFDDFNLIHIYSPSGSGVKINREKKLDFYEKLLDYLKSSNKKTIIAGDFNIAHSPKDIVNPESSSKTVNFLDEERKIIDDLEKIGFVDTFRLLNEDEIKYSSWKSQKAKEKGEGARLDYFFVSEDLKNSIEISEIVDNVEGSKHSPIQLIINI
ncbi:MAG: exodeoxyribonuclease III [Methanobrevibacter sp.]|nr:exodeoxyribonuclease III [Methanobrevibacter sp.]